MTWVEFKASAYYRMWVRLTAQLKWWQSVDEFFKKYGASPDHPVRSEVLRLIEQTRQTMDIVKRAYDSLPKPHRPGVDPYRSSGLSARLRADFQSKGITEIQQPRPPLPPA